MLQSVDEFPLGECDGCGDDLFDAIGHECLVLGTTVSATLITCTFCDLPKRGELILRANDGGQPVVTALCEVHHNLLVKMMAGWVK